MKNFFLCFAAAFFLIACSSKPAAPPTQPVSPRAEEEEKKIRETSEIVVVRLTENAARFNDKNDLSAEIQILNKLKNFLPVVVFKKSLENPPPEQVSEFRENVPYVQSVIYQTAIINKEDDLVLNYFTLKDGLNLNIPQGRILGGPSASLPPNDILSVTRIGFGDVYSVNGRVPNCPFFVLYKKRVFPSIVFKAVMELKKIKGDEINVSDGAIKIRNAEIPLNDYFSFKIDYDIDLNLKADYISYADFLNEDFTHKTASGKIFIFGDYSESAARFTENGRELTGADINAYAILTLLENLKK